MVDVMKHNMMSLELKGKLKKSIDSLMKDHSSLPNEL